MSRITHESPKVSVEVGECIKESTDIIPNWKKESLNFIIEQGQSNVYKFNSRNFVCSLDVCCQPKDMIIIASQQPDYPPKKHAKLSQIYRTVDGSYDSYVELPPNQPGAYNLWIYVQNIFGAYSFSDQITLSQANEEIKVEEVKQSN